MDLEIEHSIEDNEILETQNFEKNNETDADNCIKAVVKTEPSLAQSPAPVTKGRGLRKWRRIRRESGKETNSNLDSNRKRGMVALPVGIKQRSEGSNSSTNAVSNIVGNALDRIGLYGPDFGSRADSENSEDRSSTAASAPRMNHEVPVIGLGFDKNVMTNVGGKYSGVLVENDQKEKNRSVTKKARGVRIKKENSISSMESDSRSSNFVFAQGSNSMTSNGRRNGRSGNYEEDDSDDDARNGDGRINEEDQTVFSKNEADSEDVSREDLAGENSWEVKKEEEVDDHVVESIVPLHLAQEALEREVQKLRNVGKEDTSGSSFVDEELQSPDNVSHLHNKLEEAFIMLELKNAKISQLESALSFKEIITEHEELMTQRIAAELEYLVISKTIQNLKAGPIDQKKMHIEDASETKDVWELKNTVRRYAYCVVFQLVLLLLVLYMFVSKFLSKNVEVIPT